MDTMDSIKQIVIEYSKYIWNLSGSMMRNPNKALRYFSFLRSKSGDTVYDDIQ